MCAEESYDPLSVEMIPYMLGSWVAHQLKNWVRLSMPLPGSLVGKNVSSLELNNSSIVCKGKGVTETPLSNRSPANLLHFKSGLVLVPVASVEDELDRLGWVGPVLLSPIYRHFNALLST